MIRLYHGSNVIIDSIDLQRGRRGKDFGQGFYLSDDLPQAKRMAQITVEREGSGVPVVTVFDFDDGGIFRSGLRTLAFSSYTEEWARFILVNRKNKSTVQAHGYDYVYGPIADDRVGVQIRLFTQELITMSTLVKELSYIRPTFQYFFGTEASLGYLKKEGVVLL